jgi:phosphonate transport system substrate-binding protein
MPNAYKVSYYSWITQGSSPAQIQAAVQIFADALQTELSQTEPGTTVQLQMYADVPPQIAAVTSEPRHIALINPLGLVFASQQNAAVKAVAVALRTDAVTGAVGPFYRAQIYTANPAIQAVADVSGHSMGFGSPISTSNFLFPANLLKTNHLLWLARSLSFLGGHPQVAMAVYGGLVDVGAGHDGVIDELAQQPGYSDAAQKLRRLCWITSLPSDPVAVNIADDAERNRVAAAIVKVGQDPKVIAQGVYIFWGGSTGLAATDTSAYDSIATVLRNLAVTRQDLGAG